jgi:hypothetical protein
VARFGVVQNAVIGEQVLGVEPVCHRQFPDCFTRDFRKGGVKQKWIITVQGRASPKALWTLAKEDGAV